MGYNKAQKRLLATKPTWVKNCYRCKEKINLFVPRDVPEILNAQSVIRNTKSGIRRYTNMNTPIILHIKKKETKEIDKTVDMLERIMEKTEKLFRGYIWKDCICSCDRTNIVLEKK